MKTLQRCSRKRLREEGEEQLSENLESTQNGTDNEDSTYELPGIPPAPSNQNMNQGVTFVLEGASLALAFVGKRYRILNPDLHADFLRKKNLDPYKYRPEIVHEALLEIMSSRLCMAGNLHSVYVKTDEGVLIKVDPRACIPESLDKFCDMMSELLQKFRIKAKGKIREVLLQVVKNPVTQYLPVNSLKIGLSFSAQKAVHLREYVHAITNAPHLVFVVGAMAHGTIDSKNVDDFISVSQYPLSAVHCLREICIAVEKKWNIL